ncbi:hypothetical protein [Acidisoma sp. 7E03]
MRLARVQDRLARGMGRAAFAVGDGYALFRPVGPERPIRPETLALHLKAALHGGGRGWGAIPAYGEAVWNAVLDTAYSQPGDYLQGPLGTFFIAAQPPLLPTLCVLTNKTLTATRPDGALAPGVNGYGGVQRTQQMLLLDDWPASVLMARAGAHHGGELPGEPGPPTWSVLLPPSAQPTCGGLQPGDLLQDRGEFTAVITTVEETTLGWRLAAAQAVA